jgi:hypothetical protein
MDGVSNGVSKGVEGVGLCEHRSAKSASGEASFRSFFDEKHELVHGRIISRKRRPDALGGEALVGLDRPFRPILWRTT